MSEEFDLSPEANKTLEYILSKVENVPSLPNILSKIMEMLDDPESRVSDLQFLISQDVSLTSNVLRLANSAYYGFSGRIKTLSQAVMILGFKTIRSLVFAASAYNLLKGEIAGYGYKAEGLWKHSIINGLISREISRSLSLEDPEVGFISGLLHDIGKLVLAPIVNAHQQALREYATSQRVEFYQAERSVFGFDHGSLGARLLEQWGLPEIYVQVVRDHHLPKIEMEYFKETCCVHIANYICFKLKLCSPIDEFMRIAPNVLKTTGLTPEDIKTLYGKGKEILDDWKETFGFIK